MTERTIICVSEEEMHRLGERLSKVLKAPAFVALHGDLGAGKTALVRGVGEGLGTEEITSPTFTIVQQYDTDPVLYHFDAYRLADADELYAMGYEDYLNENALIVMEWAELVSDAVPEERLDISIEGSGLLPRKVTLRALGAVYEKILKEL